MGHIFFTLPYNVYARAYWRTAGYAPGSALKMHWVNILFSCLQIPAFDPMCWPDIAEGVPTLKQQWANVCCSLEYAKEMLPQQTQNICTFVQRRPNVFDVGATLYKCFVFTGSRLGTVPPVCPLDQGK